MRLWRKIFYEKNEAVGFGSDSNADRLFGFLKDLPEDDIGDESLVITDENSSPPDNVQKVKLVPDYLTNTIWYVSGSENIPST